MALCTDEEQPWIQSSSRHSYGTNE
ncbi:unnamed protein product [Timema podura]|uniref:Uncharacterized protein n=1 Tax=Timema podura TaxID=61482 RepID=A0ABN7PJA0_TIMPD|nr:unnamed protein product [Timema podura]